MKLRGRRKDRTMKCVEKDGEIRRVPDFLGMRLVEEKGRKFVKKSEWKSQVRDKTTNH